MKTRKPKILIATWFNCLRNLKSSLAAYNLGYDLELLTKSQGWNLASELQLGHIYKHIKVWETPSQLEKAMIESDADIIWCHNEPDLMAEIANSELVRRDRQIWHDCHDLPTLHPGYEDNKEMVAQEKAAIEQSDFTFVPTEDYVTLIEKKYPKAKGKIKVLYSCSPEMYFPMQDLPRVNGMLYCGQVNVPEMQSKLHYRNVEPLFYKLTSLGVASHIYNTTPNVNLMPYTMAGACTYGTLRMYAAIDQYTRYDYGFVGSSVDCPEIQMCMPNKLFDCIAAGIPMVSLNAKTAGKFITDNGFGVDIQGLNSLDDVPWGDKAYWDKARATVRERRYEFTMEAELTKTLKEIGVA